MPPLPKTEESLDRIAQALEQLAGIRRRRPPAPPCDTCDSTGWIEAPDMTYKGVVYTQVDACPECARRDRRAA